MTKRTSPTLLNEDFFHHLNQFTIVQNLLNDVGVRLSVVFAVWKTTLPTHLFTPLRLFIKLLHPFSKRTVAGIKDWACMVHSFNHLLIPFSDGSN
jgi:hypothetical protein